MRDRLERLGGRLGRVAAIATCAAALVIAPAGATAATGSEPPPPPVTVNEFVPERDLSECVSALPKPDCGSEARGDWRQGLVFVAMTGGMAFVAWRIVRGVRRGQPAADPARPR
jgi:hypothetical protein